MPHMSERFKAMPYFLIFPLLAFFAIMNIPYQIKKKNDGWAFISSCASLALLLILYGCGTFPNIVLSSIDSEYSLTIFNTASSQGTLMNLLIVVIIGVPLVLAYGFWIYRVFRGKVKLEHTSY
jgi:cytochrome d ubiquinol oxidase subunit II